MIRLVARSHTFLVLHRVDQAIDNLGSLARQLSNKFGCVPIRFTKLGQKIRWDKRDGLALRT